ncbi:MAG: hypothetical protein EA398_06325 [Deltaproteobacteria bacterium]|nr:MAG: hypothetical protein EA398_06325 [Deltaproteobacteria bacterium]
MACVAILVALWFGPACASIYRLPDPDQLTDERQRPDSSADTAENEVPSDERAEIAARVLTALHAALLDGRVDEAWELLSHETRLALDHHHPSGGDQALRDGWLEVDGRRLAFRPARLLLLPDVESVSARSQEASVSAGPRRIEASIRGGGEERSVVLIREGVHWRLHLPRIPREHLDSPESP